MRVIVERWRCAACECDETTGGALPRGWRYVPRGGAIVTVCEPCKAKAQRCANEAYTRALWGRSEEPSGGW